MSAHDDAHEPISESLKDDFLSATENFAAAVTDFANYSAETASSMAQVVAIIDIGSVAEVLKDDAQRLQRLKAASAMVAKFVKPGDEVPTPGDAMRACEKKFRGIVTDPVKYPESARKRAADALARMEREGDMGRSEGGDSGREGGQRREH